MKITVYDNKGQKKSDLALNKEIFWIEPNLELMHRYLVLQRANSRYNLSKTLTKWEVAWWWRKPFRQKWTWRARQWSITNPHYVWWWVSHWPRWNRNFSLMMPRKMRRKALFSYLSKKASDEKIFWLEWFKSEKTKDLKNLLETIKFDRNLLLVISEKEKNENIIKTANNLENVKVILSNYLNPVDLTKFRNVCFYWDSLDKLNSVFLNK